MNNYTTVYVNGILSKEVAEKCRTLSDSPFLKDDWRCPVKEEDFSLFEEIDDNSFKVKTLGLVFPYRVVVVTGPAGSGKTFSTVNYIVNLLDDVIVTGTTNTSVTVMNNATSFSKYYGTIYKLIRFKKPLKNLDLGVVDQASNFSQVQFRNLATYWPTLASIVRDIEDFREIKMIIRGSEERAKLLKQLHPNRIPDLALGKYIFIDECGQAPHYMLDAIAFIRSRMRFSLGLSTNDTPVFILIGSPTQTQAFELDKNGKTSPCDSIIDGVFHSTVVRETLEVINNSVRFIKIKRCEDDKYNECMYKLEHGISLWSERFYFDRFVTENESLITDPREKFHPELVRLFLRHEEVRKYLQNHSESDYKEENIYCVVSVNDSRIFFSSKGPQLQHKIQSFISRNNIGSHSQFTDSLYQDQWEFVRSAPLLTKEGNEQEYQTPGFERKSNFFEPCVKYNVEFGFSDPPNKRMKIENKEVMLFRNTIRIKPYSRVVLCRKSSAMIIGFEGSFQSLLNTVQNTRELFVTFLFQLAHQYQIHSNEGCLLCRDQSIWEKMSPFMNAFQMDSRLTDKFIIDESTLVKQKLKNAAENCSHLRKNHISLCLLESSFIYRLPKINLSGGTICQFIDFVSYKVKEERPYSQCEFTFPEIKIRSSLVKRNDLLFLLIPRPTFKHIEDDSKKIYDFCILYDIPIQNCLSMTTAKSTGISLEGACCVFPRKITPDLMRTVYVMMSRVKNSEAIYINYNIFKNKKLYNTVPGKGQLINLMQLRNMETTLLL